MEKKFHYDCGKKEKTNTMFFLGFFLFKWIFCLDYPYNYLVFMERKQIKKVY